MAKTVLIMNGPNLNMLGLREPEIYGSDTLDDVIAQCAKLGGELGLAIRDVQSNAEHVLIDAIHDARGKIDALIINPGAFTHTSIALHDALVMLECPIFEVHISNIHAREPFRHHSYVSPIASGVVMGCGVEGYAMALRRAASVIG
jgi:3-dehydroquinate dehydratase-2